MPRNQTDDVDVVELLSTVPLAAYDTIEEAYRWPQKNRCPNCLVGKFKHIGGTTIIACKTCDLEVCIPHEA